MSFHSLYDQGFARVAALTFPVHLANPAANAREVLDLARRCDEAGVALAVTPELSLTGYSNDDLFLQDELREATLAAVDWLRQETSDLLPVLIVGAPLALGDKLYNCALFIHRGKLLAVTPKYHLPNYREFYDKRYFSTCEVGKLQWVRWVPEAGGLVETNYGPGAIPFGLAQLRAIDLPGFNVCAEICEDMWVPVAPSLVQSLQGATVVANLSASPVTVGRARGREETVRSLSTRSHCAYVYTAAGYGESSTDLSWDGQSLVYEAGTPLAQSQRFAVAASVTMADVDVAGLRRDRLQQNSFADNAAQVRVDDYDFGIVEFTLGAPDTDFGLIRPLSRFPFVPDDPDQLDSDCWESFNIQVSALCRRLQATRSEKLVIGVSGGLDSTHALLVAARAMDVLGRPRTDILAYTMPGFGTTGRSRGDAEQLCLTLGASFEELDIRPAAEQMLKTMEHPAGSGEAAYDVTYENVQAGLRTDYLFRLANHHRGMVLGTGDLSELALGWCTYGVGDQMSHYGVNVGLPKTMIQHLIRWVATSGVFGEDLAPVLDNILGAEISPELIPPDSKDRPQSTQDAIGPYALHDFTLYQVLERGMGVRRIAFLAEKAWGDAQAGQWPQGISEADKVAYDLPTIVKWLRVFFRRFFSNQFKRSAIPNGPKMMAGGALSPRGEWRMPSDAQVDPWIRQVDELAAELGLGGRE